MTRELSSKEIVRELLESYLDARDALDRSEKLAYGGQAGSVCLLMSPLWHEGSYAELEDGLRVLRDAEPFVYWHLAERYTRCSSRIVTGCGFCRQESRIVHRHALRGRLEKYEPTRISVKTVSKAVKPERVDAGVRFLDEWFRSHDVTPWLPREVYEAVAA